MMLLCVYETMVLPDFLFIFRQDHKWTNEEMYSITEFLAPNKFSGSHNDNKQIEPNHVDKAVSPVKCETLVECLINMH